MERELSDNKHAEYLWGLYNQKPTSQKKQEAYESFGIYICQAQVQILSRKSKST